MITFRYVLASAAVCCALISAFSQSQPPQLYPIPVHDKWGYIDRNGDVRIPARFDSVSAFREGVAVAEVNGKYGFIDLHGTFIVQPTFDDAYAFSEGLAATCVGDRCGYIDHSGKFVISPQYGTRITFPGAKAFSEGLAAVFTNGHWGYIDRTGRMVIPPRYGFAKGFSDGLAAVGIEGGRDGPAAFGFIDHHGQISIALRYHGVNSFHEGAAVVAELLGKSYEKSVIDRTGRRIYGPVTDAIADYHEGLAAISGLNERILGFIDRQGKVVVPMPKRFAGSLTFFSEGLAPVESADGQLGYINRTGEFVIKGKFGMTCHFSGGLAFILAENSAGYIDTTGRIVWKAPLASSGEVETCPDY